MLHLNSSRPSTALPRKTPVLLSDQQLAMGYLVVASLVFFGFTIYYAIHRAFWYDEIFTFYVASLPDPATIWRSLLGGMDFHPPLDYLIRHYSMLLFGHSELGARLPSIVAFYGAFLCVFFYGRAAHSTLAGVIASTLLLSAPAMYAVEGRGYAFMIAFGTAAMLLWRRLSRDDRAPVWMWVALGACLTGSVWTHYYGLLTIAAFCIAGLVNWIERRRVPVKLLVTGIVTGIAIIPVAPFALGARSYAAKFWALPDPFPLEAFREALGSKLYLPAVETFVLVALCSLLLGRTRPVRWFLPRGSAQPGFSASEIALLAAVQFEPVMQWVLARFVTHAFTWHYTIVSLGAASVVGGIFLARGCARHSTVVLAVCCALCFVQAPSSLRRLSQAMDRETRQEVLSKVAALDARMASSPDAVVAPHGNNFLQCYFYGSDRVKKNLVMLGDREAAVRLGFTDNDDIALQNLAKFVPIRFEPFAAFTVAHPRIDLTTGRYDKETWVTARLLEAGYQVYLLAPPVNEIMYHCERR
jgi:hypothetical protein